MLQYLQIKNLALIKCLTLDFDSGFTAVTGETGAGKSVLLGALALLSGARKDKTIIHQGTESCEVEATLFFPQPERINRTLEALNLPHCDDNTLIIKRTLSYNKAPKILVNGALTTLTNLQTLGEAWIDFHGPGEPQKLFHPKHQLNLLDLYAGLSPLTKEYSDLYQSWQKKLKEAQALAKQEQLSEDEIHFYQTQIDKINAINLTPEAIEELEQSYTRISRAQELGDMTQSIYSGLSNSLSQLQNIARDSQELATIDPSTTTLNERIQSAIIEIEDLSSDVRHLEATIDCSPTALQDIQKRMNTWIEIERQYGPTLEGVIKKRDALLQKIASQGDIDAMIAKIKDEAKIFEDQLWDIAKKIETKRRSAAKTLSQKTQKILKTLGFQRAALEIQVIKEPQLQEYGSCNAAFYFSPNSGQDLLPLNKIASSGETARVMLALKAILAKVDSTPVLVFDEVDANVGGEIGAKVAQEMANIAKNHQVFCVTHLPQVASQANHHFLVTKTQSDTHTEVHIGPIDHEDSRIQELARMLGDRTSKTAIKHAQELLKA